MNEYEISKLKKQLQRKIQLLKEEQQDHEQTEKQLIEVSAQRDKYHTELLIARKQIDNIDKIIAENVKTMRAKLEQENFISLNQLKDLKEKLKGELFLNQKLVEQNRNKDATIAELSGRLIEMSKKYKDPSLLVNTKEISEQVQITHNQFYKLTEKYNKLSKDMENIMAENKILRKLHGVPDNFGFDLEEIKIAQKQELQNYKAQCRKLENQIEELEAQRTQLRYRLRQYNTLYSNKGDRFKDMTQQQLQLLDLYAMNLKQGKFDLPQIDKSQKQMQREILKLKAQVEVLQNKAPMSIMQMGKSSINSSANDKVSNDQIKKMQEQIKSYLEPLVQDMKKFSQTNLNNLIQGFQNFQNNQNGNSQMPMNLQGGNFKGPIPLPIANNDWSKIKEGYSFLYSSKIPIDLKDLEGDIIFDVVKAKYEIAALQLQNIESLKLLKQKQKVQNSLSQEIFDLKEKYKKCLKVQDQLFLRYFKDQEKINSKIQKLEIQKLQLINQNKQLETKVEILQSSFDEISKKGDLQKKIKEITTRSAIAEAEELRLQRKYQVLSQQFITLKQTYTRLQTKLNQTEHSLKIKLLTAKSNERQLTDLVNRILEQNKNRVSWEVYSLQQEKMQLLNDKTVQMVSKQTELRLRLQKLQGLERESIQKNNTINNLRQDNLEIWLELQIVKNRLKLVDIDYRSYCDTLERFVKFLNESNISLMKLFKAMDDDKSGKLNKKQFGDQLKKLKFVMSPTELDLLFAQFDIDGSQSITYKQFIKKLRRAGAISRTQQQEAVLRLFKAIKQSNISIQQAFRIIDEDNSKSIKKFELQKTFSQIGITATTKTVDYLFKLCDNNDDGQISLDQFTKLYRDMVKDTNEIQDENYNDEIDWKLAFVLKLQEVSQKFNSTLSETFKKLDENGNSVLTITELSEFIKNAQLQMDSSALKELFDFLDRRRDGKIQYGQFLKILAQAKNEKLKIQRFNNVRQTTKKLRNESQRMLSSQKIIESQSAVIQASELEKIKIRLEGLSAKHKNLITNYNDISMKLAKAQQSIFELDRSLKLEQQEKEDIRTMYFKQKESKVSLQALIENSKSNEITAPLKKQINELKISKSQLTKERDLYKGLYQGMTDKNKNQVIKLGNLEAECRKYYNIVKQLQSASQSNAEFGKLHIQLQYSKRNEEIINSKYDKIVQQLRKIDGETSRLVMIATEKQKEIISTHLFYDEKCKLQQMKIDEFASKFIPSITMQKMNDFLIKLRQVSNSKSSLQQQNMKLRETNYNLQARNDYVQNQRVYITQLQRKLRDSYPGKTQQQIIDLTKKLSQYKMSQLKAKREMAMLKQKEQYYLRLQNSHNDNIKQLEQQLANWESKFNQREEFWRKNLASKIKIMEEFQKQVNKAKQEQATSLKYFNQKKEQQIQVNKKYQELNPAHFSNISQFIKPEINNAHDDEYTEQLLDKIAKLQQQLSEKQRDIYQFKSAVKDIIPESNMNNLVDFGSQMNISTNSFVIQTQMTNSQLKNNARRFLNSQKQIETYYKQQNARITKAAQQSILTLQKMIDEKNEQLRKKQSLIDNLKNQFNQSSSRDCHEIQKLHEQIRELRSKTQVNNINQIMSRTTKNNFYASSKADSKLEEYQQLVNSKEMQIKILQDKYDKLFITKTSANNEKTAAKNALNAEKLKQKLDELAFERQIEKKKFQEKEKDFEKQILNLRKVDKEKTKKIEQLNKAIKDIKEDIINEKNSVQSLETEQNYKKLVQNLIKGTNKNDGALQQYVQSFLQKIKNLQNQNRDLRQELNRAKEIASKTVNKFHK